VALLRWREALEREFRRRPKVPPDAKAMQRLKLRHARERLRDARLLADGAASLRRIADDLERRRPALRAAALARAEELRAAEAEARISPLFYKTWT
jgi:hypothetical protein